MIEQGGGATRTGRRGGRRGGQQVLARCDLAIVGAGAAGLLLAVRLVREGWRGHRLLLIDDGLHPLHERAWAFWASGPGLDGAGLLADAIGPTWSRLAVRGAGRRLELRAEPYSYRLVRGSDLIAASAAVLSGCPAFEQVTDRVTRIVDGPERALVALAGGGVIEAGWVFDSRPPPAPGPGRPRLGFVGWELVTPGPQFDPGLATLMDFGCAQRSGGPAGPADGVRFCYLLPTAPDRALVELVRIGWDPPGSGELTAALTGYLQDRLAPGSWRLLRREAAELPLRPADARRPGGRVLAIGRPAGILKPSTGFGFQRAVRDAGAIARSMVSSGHPFALPRPSRRHRQLDQLLLEVVRREPERIEPVLVRMFAANPTARVLRFLDEDTTRRQELALIRTLPAGPFLRAVPAIVRAGLRRPRSG